MHSETTRYALIEGPVGEVMLTSDGESLTGVHLGDSARPRWNWCRDERALGEAARQLGEYFAGERSTFDLAIKWSGTAFQERTWAELLNVPYGETISYGELARRIGKPAASRAVGLANGRNPLAIVVPCHRVIGANGSLTGYGGGLERKRLLLRLEHEAMAWRRIRSLAIAV